MTNEDILQSIQIAKVKVYQYELAIAKDKQYLDEVKQILHQLEWELNKEDSNETI